ncbi:hypothetical protein AZE42_06455 [Rhizopogon vesiculosus]|uniref:Uncharacterized protein n=1 Tax=Rhizopogon vesiculosus TaxID=180088 RepID=A0A1J8QMZ6_9AGAM|nr:hypothetical protein AZE42_06455 [Rhizopogon vesiculosus]
MTHYHDPHASAFNVQLAPGHALITELWSCTSSATQSIKHGCHFTKFSINAMLYNDNESNTSARRRDVEREELFKLDSPAIVTSPKRQENPPPYGAQHLQDALWKGEQLFLILFDGRNSRETGGNEALPPLWQEFKVLDSQIRYEDNNLYMGSWSRPLPGVRLGKRSKVPLATRTHSEA